MTSKEHLHRRPNTISMTSPNEAVYIRFCAPLTESCGSYSHRLCELIQFRPSTPGVSPSRFCAVHSDATWHNDEAKDEALGNVPAAELLGSNLCQKPFVSAPCFWSVYRQSCGNSTCIEPMIYSGNPVMGQNLETPLPRATNQALLTSDAWSPCTWGSTHLPKQRTVSSQLHSGPDNWQSLK